MSKPFFFRIDLVELLDFATEPEGANMSLLQFAKELKRGQSDIPQIQKIIDETHEFIEKKKDAAHKRWNAPHVQSDAPHMQSNARSSNRSRSSTEKKEKKIFSSEVYRLADLLIELMLKNNPLHRELSNDKRQHSRERYADDIDRLIRIDQRPPPHIEKVIRHSQQDDFWRINVLSAATLRKHWDKLAVKALRFEILKERHNGSGNFSEGNRDDRGPVQDELHGEGSGRNMGKCPF